MGRPSKIKNGITASIYIDSRYKDIAKLCKEYSDGDIYTIGLETILKANGSVCALEKILEIKRIEKEQLEEDISFINSRIDMTRERKRIKVHEIGDPEVYEIDEKDFDPNRQRRV